MAERIWSWSKLVTRRAAPARGGARGAQAVVAHGAAQREAVADDRHVGRSQILDALAPTRKLLVAARQTQIDLVRPLLGHAAHRPLEARVLDAVAGDHQLLEAVVAPLPRDGGWAAHVVGGADPALPKASTSSLNGPCIASLIVSLLTASPYKPLPGSR